MSRSEAAMRGRARRYADRQLQVSAFGTLMRSSQGWRAVYRAYLAGARSSRRRR